MYVLLENEPHPGVSLSMPLASRSAPLTKSYIHHTAHGSPNNNSGQLTVTNNKKIQQIKHQTQADKSRQVYTSWHALANSFMAVAVQLAMFYQRLRSNLITPIPDWWLGIWIAQKSNPHQSASRLTVNWLTDGNVPNDHYNGNVVCIQANCNKVTDTSRSTSFNSFSQFINNSLKIVAVRLVVSLTIVSSGITHTTIYQLTSIRSALGHNMYTPRISSNLNKRNKHKLSN